MGWKANLLYLVIFSCFSGDLAAQPWSGVLSTARATNWANAGLPAALPDGETSPNPWTPPARTQCGSTISAGASPATINLALAACGAGHYVLLGAGTFTVNSSITMYAQSGVTLRGSGPQGTILNVTGSAYIDFGIAWAGGSCSWASGFSPGTTSLTMTGCSGPTLVAGELLLLKQCDSGYSGAGCATGSATDNGALYICGDNNACQFGSDTGTNNHQVQVVYVNSVTGSGGGPFAVTFNPGLYMPNWASGNTPLATWITSSSSGNTPAPYGNGLEDLTVYTTGSTTNYSVYLNLSYASWVKGVRFIGSGINNPLALNSAKNCLVLNNYFFSDIALDGNFPAPLQMGSMSDSLVLNNIMTSGVPWEGFGSNEANVVAYNYGRDTFTMYYEVNFFDHHAGTAFGLFEGNQTGIFTGDNTWGTHDLDTLFRNYWSGWDPPYKTINQRGVEYDAYSRFENAVGNSIGPGPGTSPLSTYQATSGNQGFIFAFDNQGNNDPLVLASSMRWGNCDTVTNTCRFQSSEVPAALSGNAVPFQNSVPGMTNLPCSFFLAGYSSINCTSHPSGGTGLNWWKVCTSWTTFPTSCATSQAQPFPAIGPDVTGGPYVNGTAYDIPAAIAFKNLPIDANFQNSYGIVSSTWAGGTETLTVSGLPNTTHLMGGFQITGVAGCNSPAGGEFLMTASTATTISYALASNPGSCGGGTVKFPDVRMFDEAVYQNDSAGGTGPNAPTGVTVTAH